MKKVLVDTNIFFLPFTEGIDALEKIKDFFYERNESNIEFYTLKKNIWELEHLYNTAKSEKKRKLINMIKKYIELKNVKVIDSPLNEKTDRLLIKKALEDPNTYIIATQDKNLRKAAKYLKIKTIFFKRDKELVFS